MARHRMCSSLTFFSANLTDALVSCPGDLTSIFQVTAMSTYTSCNNATPAELDGLSAGILNFTYTSCVSSIVFNSTVSFLS